ncbi:MAG: Tim44 domain-containing protein [Nitrospiraceae bacterium]|nr:Tim44 domain-containing protein [Nitrospiraceae bacterium]
MTSKKTKILVLVALTLFIGSLVFEGTAFARVGGSKSFGSRGSRSYSTPSRTPAQQPAQSPSRMQQPVQQPQPAGGGFFRGIAGGILGGLLGGMLFSSLGFGSTGGFGGSGIGLLEILLAAGVIFLIIRMIKKKKQETAAYQYAGQPASYSTRTEPAIEPAYEGSQAAGSSLDSGLSHISSMDASFDEARFRDTAMDIFFRIQGSWMNRDLSAASGLLTDSMRTAIQQDIDSMIKQKQINRLENIAVRSTDITEAWQETGQDFITVRFYANLLDYTVSETTGELVSGSKTEPVKFEEYWTFTRQVGNNQWQLTAINQA